MALGGATSDEELLKIYEQLMRDCKANPDLRPTAEFRLLALGLEATAWLERASKEVAQGGDVLKARLRLTMGRLLLQRSETSTATRLIGFFGSRHRAALHAAVVELDAIAHGFSVN